MAKRDAQRKNRRSMLIRRLTARTAGRALPLIEAQYREHRIEMGGARLRRALRLLLAGRGIVLVALDPDPVGVAVLSTTITIEHGGRVAWLDELYVVPDRRGRGLGRTLLLKALSAARKAGCAAVELEVVRGHDRAARLYLREGFRRLPRSRFSLRL